MKLFMLLGGTALAGSLVFAVNQAAGPADPVQPSRIDPKIAELLDPSRAAALACRGHARDGRLAALLGISRAYAAATDQEALEDGPPLYDGLGDLAMPVTTEFDDAQAYFNQGLRLAWAFNHAAAARAFRAAQEIDPDCAMCYWGEALVLGPNINAPMPDEAREPAMEALAAAQARKADATSLEQALINALSSRYSREGERSALDAIYSKAMQAVADMHGDNTHVLALAAEAIMDTQPWDYWEPDGRTPKGDAGKAITFVEKVLERNPNHAGAIHLYIHLVEASDTPERAEHYAEKLAAQMPAAGHIVHMGSHIFYRIGRYADSLKTNVKAIAADEAYFDAAGRAGIYGYGYYPHNVHFVVTSALMAGDGATALQMADKLASLVPIEMALEVPWMQPIIAAPLFAKAQFAHPQVIFAEPKPDARMPYVVAMWHYARGVAFAAAGDFATARAEREAIDAIGASADFSGLTEGGVPAPKVLELAAHLIAGRIAQAESAPERAAEAFRRAATIQDQLPYTEPPYWYYPVRQSLGAALLAAGDADGAVKAFRQSLFDAPNNGYALYGLVEAERARGNTAAAAAAERAYGAAWVGTSPPVIEEL